MTTDGIRTEKVAAEAWRVEDGMSKGEEAARLGGARQEIALLLRKGFARHQAGDLAAAMTLYGQALAIDPKQPDAHCNYANVLQSSGRLKEAHHHFNRAIALKPRMAMAYRNLGNLCRLMGTWDEAVAAYQRAIEINGEDPEVLCYLGDLLGEQEEPDAAIACYRRAMAADPDFPRAPLNLSAALQRLGRLEEALAVARKAVAVAPAQAPPHYRRRRSGAKNGRTGARQRSLRRSGRSRPHNLLNGRRGRGKAL